MNQPTFPLQQFGSEMPGIFLHIMDLPLSFVFQFLSLATCQQGVDLPDMASHWLCHLHAFCPHFLK